MRLTKEFGNERLEAACKLALAADTVAYRSIHSILKNRLDQQPLPESAEQLSIPIQHPNIRGAHDYRQNKGDMTC